MKQHALDHSGSCSLPWNWVSPPVDMLIALNVWRPIAQYFASSVLQIDRGKVKVDNLKLETWV